MPVRLGSGRRNRGLYGGVGAVLFLAAGGPPVTAQKVDVVGDFLFYGDNTEFFNPFRSGETLLGAQLESAVSVALGPRVRILAGVSGDFRSGSDDFRELEPVLSFRYSGDHTVTALGTLIRGDRHGLVDPLAVSTLRFRRATEQGIQWLGRWPFFDGEVFLNWQRLVGADRRERFDYGLVAEGRVGSTLAVLAQLHGVHEGDGQLADVEDGKSNNVALALGARMEARIPGLSRSSVTGLFLRSSGDIPDPPPDRRSTGKGAYLRTSVMPGGWFELFTVHWWGRDFVAVEGDANYGSRMLDPGSFRRDRRYTEVGFRRTVELEAGVVFSSALRFHKVDGARGTAISGTTWEYSYRFTVAAPVRIPLWPFAEAGGEADEERP